MRDVPIEIGRDEAREAARRELADPVYQSAEPSLAARVLEWLVDRLSELIDSLSALAPGGVAGLIVLALLGVVLVVIVRLRVGKPARAGHAGRSVFGPRSVSAADHRQAAQSAVASGDLSEAILERFRAIVRELEQRGVLDEQSGRTVDEIADQAGRLLPRCAVELRDAARIFDDVVYGGHPATVQQYQVLAMVDQAARTERPTFAGTSP